MVSLGRPSIRSITSIIEGLVQDLTPSRRRQQAVAAGQAKKSPAPLLAPRKTRPVAGASAPAQVKASSLCCRVSSAPATAIER
ncbi:MAG: hypothetical protein VW684_14405, partial [Betaproteobacteria bacterium]